MDVSPLYALRLTTPRLELRLGSRAELLELGRLAERGIHPPVGTEMRAAVLELAFEGLDARTAESGWLEGNEGSRRVSEKLGYVEIGSETATPRGAPVVQHNVALERASWVCPVPVELDGLGGCRSLFGSSEG